MGLSDQGGSRICLDAKEPANIAAIYALLYCCAERGNRAAGGAHWLGIAVWDDAAACKLFALHHTI